MTRSCTVERKPAPDEAELLRHRLAMAEAKRRLRAFVAELEAEGVPPLALGHAMAEITFDTIEAATDAAGAANYLSAYAGRRYPWTPHHANSSAAQALFRHDGSAGG